MRKPIREVNVVLPTGGSPESITIDFDMVECMTKHRQTVKVGSNHAPAILPVTAIQLKNGKQFMVKEEYEELRDWWIEVNQQVKA